jgi:hypothetical protein
MRGALYVRKSFHRAGECSSLQTSFKMWRTESQIAAGAAVKLSADVAFTGPTLASKSRGWKVLRERQILPCRRRVCRSRCHHPTSESFRQEPLVHTELGGVDRQPESAGLYPWGNCNRGVSDRDLRKLAAFEVLRRTCAVRRDPFGIRSCDGSTSFSRPMGSNGCPVPTWSSVPSSSLFCCGVSGDCGRPVRPHRITHLNGIRAVPCGAGGDATPRAPTTRRHRRWR